MRKMIVSMMVLTGFLAGQFLAAPAPLSAKGKSQTVCPIMGGAIDKSVYVDYEGKRIYFCCKGCPEDFKKDPKKYMKKLRDSGVEPEKAPTAAKKK